MSDFTRHRMARCYPRATRSHDRRAFHLHRVAPGVVWRSATCASAVGDMSGSIGSHASSQSSALRAPDRLAWPGTCFPSIGSFARSLGAALHAFRAIRPSGRVPVTCRAASPSLRQYAPVHAVARPAAWRITRQFASRPRRREAARAPGGLLIGWHAHQLPGCVTLNLRASAGTSAAFPSQSLSPSPKWRDTGSPPLAGPLPLRRARSAHTPRTSVLRGCRRLVHAA